MALPLIIGAVAGTSYIANDFFSWASKDDGSPPPTTKIGNNIPTLAVAGGLAIGSYILWKKLR